MDTRNSEKLFSYLETIHTRCNELTERLATAEVTSNPRLFRELSKELFSLKSLNAKYTEFSTLRRRIADTAELQQLAEDEEMRQLAAEEAHELQGQLAALEQEVQELMVSDVVDDDRNVFLEIRAGAGGDEASLFAGDLLRMYSRVAERKNWKTEVISTAYSGIGGIKEVVLYVRGQNVHRFLRFESGVHRVQRVPVTEASGRIHTSTITVAVLPEVDDVEIEINPKDLRIDTYAASGPGGQHVNKTESAIRITHFPTGIVVTCQDEKSQHKNKDKAMKVLKARLYEHEMEKQHESIASNRRSQVGSGERSEKIRTYNFPQSRVTDHRISSRNFNIEFILDGDLDDLCAELQQIHTRERIAREIERLLS